jgi:hypothetical protein
LTVFSPAKAQVVRPVANPAAVAINDLPPPETQKLPPKSIHNEYSTTSKLFFNSTGILWVGVGGDKPPDPNKAKLGKSESPGNMIPSRGTGG